MTWTESSSISSPLYKMMLVTVTSDGESRSCRIPVLLSKEVSQVYELVSSLMPSSEQSPSTLSLTSQLAASVWQVLATGRVTELSITLTSGSDDKKDW